MITPDFNEDSSSNSCTTNLLVNNAATNSSGLNLKRKNIDFENLNEQLRSSKSVKRLSDDSTNDSTTSKCKCSNLAEKSSIDNWLGTFDSLSNNAKMYALQQLLEQCDYTHIKHVHTIIEPKLQRDYISELPRELALTILTYIQAKDLCKLAQVSTYWRQLSDDCILWKKLCVKRKLKELYLNDEQFVDKTKNSANIWKQMYLTDYNLVLNWTTRPLPKPSVLKGHEDHVITCLKFDGSYIVSGSDDCSLKVWDAQTGECVQTLVGHTGGVWSSQLKDNLLVSGSTDRSVRVWRLDTGECVHVLLGHTSTVRCLALHNDTVVSGSRDATLRVWDIKTGKLVNILRGHGAAVRCVCFDGTYIVSGSYDYTIRVWKPNSQRCIHTLEGHLNRVYSLLFDGKRIISGSLDTTIIVWDVETGRIVHKLIGHQSLTSGMQVKGDVLVSGNADANVKIWSLTSGECMHTLAGDYKHLSAVTCIVFNEKFVISSSDDGTVKLWNIETGEFIRNLLTLESGGRGGVVWRLSMVKNKLVCAVGSRMGTEETKLLLFDFDLINKESGISVASCSGGGTSSNVFNNNLNDATLKQITNS